MFRNSFNAGELSEQVSLRPELDVYSRGCSLIKNFDLSEQGGVSRRKGFRWVYTDRAAGWSCLHQEAAADAAVHIFNASDNASFVLLFFVEKSGTTYTLYVNIITRDPKEKYKRTLVKRRLGIAINAQVNVHELQFMQLNASLIITHNDIPPLELRLDAEKNNWTLTYFFDTSNKRKLPNYPWRNYELQDEIELKLNGSVWNATGANIDDLKSKADYLRVSVYTDEAVMRYGLGVNVTQYSMRYVTEFRNFKKGDIIYYDATVEDSWWTFKEDFIAGQDDPEADIFAEGMTHPSSYPNVFQKVDKKPKIQNGHAVDFPNKLCVTEDLKSAVRYKKGDLLCFETRFSRVFTCIADYVSFSPTDTTHFVEGFVVAKAPCKGKWRFVNTGTWFGEYVVRASYDDEFSEKGEFEVRGSVKSLPGEPINQEIAGDESDEECWISLWLTKAYMLQDCVPDLSGTVEPLIRNMKIWYNHDPATRPWSYKNYRAYEPLADQIKLIVDSYKKDLVFVKSGNGYKMQTGMQGGLSSVKTYKTENWSVEAFSKGNYPACVAMIDQRMCFGGTREQPMTVWMSKTNDIDNFGVTESDDSALILTVASDTQNPIRWMSSQRGALFIGTSRGEFVIDAGGSGGAITNKTATVVRHGFNGSEKVPAVVADDSIIYLTKGGQRMKMFGYQENVGGYISTDLNTFADTILLNGGGVRKFAVQKSPISRILCVLNDGTMAVLTFNNLQQVQAWAHYELSDQLLDYNDETYKFIDVAVETNKSLNDTLYAIVTYRTGLNTWVTDLMEQSDDAEFFDYTDVASNIPYESCIISNILSTTQIRNPKQDVGEIMFYLGEDRQADGIEITVDGGETWSALDYPPNHILKKGWHSQLGFGTVTWDTKVGIRVKEGEGLIIRAIQVI